MGWLLPTLLLAPALGAAVRAAPHLSSVPQQAAPLSRRFRVRATTRKTAGSTVAQQVPAGIQSNRATSRPIVEGGDADDKNRIPTAHERHLRAAQAGLIPRLRAPRLGPLKKMLTKAQAYTYFALFFSLSYLWCLSAQALFKVGVFSELERQKVTIRMVGQIASSLLSILPFFELEIHGQDNVTREDGPVVWVANHVSELDLLVFLAIEGRLKVGKKRPIKFLYWSELDQYPVLSTFVKTSGMIPVEMEDTGFEIENQYKLHSVKDMMKRMNSALDEGFDIAILPEGRRNPDAPTLGKAFPGAYRLAKKHKAPIQFIGTHGIEDVWNVADGLHCGRKRVSVNIFPKIHNITSQEEFARRFYDLIGPWAASKTDVVDS